ncbi:MAG TPA: hypothetical protein H9668_08295 [Firmicutes bacterium]|nr:hypothetical protein [Bacillota bacterium]
MQEILHRFSLEYFCLRDKIAATGTLHTHLSVPPLQHTLFCYPEPIPHGTYEEGHEAVRLISEDAAGRFLLHDGEKASL